MDAQMPKIKAVRWFAPRDMRLVEEERSEEAAAVRDQIRGMEHEGFHTDQ